LLVRRSHPSCLEFCGNSTTIGNKLFILYKDSETLLHASCLISSVASIGQDMN
jgi:hypothetical protein